MKNNKTRNIAITGMLFALAMVLSFLEGIFTPLMGLPPGVKLGLANIVVMYALFFMGRKEAVMLIILKSLFAFLTRGAIAAVLSFCGGGLSLMALMLLMLLKKAPPMFIMSVTGAIMHNIGQLLALRFLVTTSPYTIYYLPILLISGVVMGALTSVSLQAVLPALAKLGIEKKQ